MLAQSGPLVQQLSSGKMIGVVHAGRPNESEQAVFTMNKMLVRRRARTRYGLVIFRLEMLSANMMQRRLRPIHQHNHMERS
jgi:hypothetical protein